MNSKTNASGNDRVYEDYEPPFEWVAEEDPHTLIVFLPGFTRQKLRVQITLHGNLRLSGERQVSENKWQRFSKEFPIPSDSNIDQTAANFESGVLYIKMPRAIPTTTNTLQEQTKKPTEEQEQTKKPTEEPPPRPQKPPSDESQTQKKGLEEKAAQKKPSDESQTQKKGLEEKAAQKKPSDIKKDTNEIKEVTNDFVKDSDEKRLKNEKIGDGDGDGDGDGEGETKEMNDTAMCCNLRPQGSKEGVNLVKETKNKSLINLIVAVLFLLVIGFYVKNGIFKSEGESKRTEL